MSTNCLCYVLRAFVRPYARSSSATCRRCMLFVVRGPYASWSDGVGAPSCSNRRPCVRIVAVGFSPVPLLVSLLLLVISPVLLALFHPSSSSSQSSSSLSQSLSQSSSSSFVLLVLVSFVRPPCRLTRPLVSSPVLLARHFAPLCRLAPLPPCGVAWLPPDRLSPPPCRLSLLSLPPSRSWSSWSCVLSPLRCVLSRFLVVVSSRIRPHVVPHPSRPSSLLLLGFVSFWWQGKMYQ